MKCWLNLILSALGVGALVAFSIPAEAGMNFGQHLQVAATAGGLAALNHLRTKPKLLAPKE